METHSGVGDSLEHLRPQKRRRLCFTPLALVCVSALLSWSQMGYAQGTWRELIKDKIRARRSQRLEGRRSRTAGAGDVNHSLLHGGVTRTYRLHVPPSYRRTAPAPLVFAFHGGGGSSDAMADDHLYHWTSASDREGFVVVFPNGSSRRSSGQFATWNAGNCCAYARDQNVDDVGFVRAMIRELERTLSVDKNRIYAAGFSNGGMLAYRLACEMSEVFKAVASVAGTENLDACHPAAPISIFHIHANNDDHVLFEGGAGAGAARDPSQVTEYTSVAETISRWVRRNGCEGDAERVLATDGVFCDRYAGCKDQASVQLCVTEEGGHSWPGGNKPRPQAAQPSGALNATEAIWEFFTRQEDQEDQDR